MLKFFEKILNENYYSLFIYIITSLLFSFFISIIFIHLFTIFLKKIKFNQPIRKYVPSSHLKKIGIPTMGGLVIIINIIISTSFFSNLYSLYTLYIFFILISYGCIGFVDDYQKIFSKNNKGLNIKQKYFLQSFFAIVLLIIMKINDGNIFLLKNKDLFFYFFSYLIIVGFSNAVNLTDGLDGLVTVPIILVYLGFLLISFITSDSILSSYFKINYFHKNKELLIVCSIVIGSCLGFLWFNCYPATIFMGDSGSLSLGGLMGLMSILLHKEIILIIIGGLFVIETLSVILQIFFFKFKNYKPFLMAPIHHHYELKGYSESKIIVRFWIISLILLIIGFFLIKYL